ncbi:HNH endonuclease [Streptomyces sp. NBC_00063]|uniref:HNH endonuclease n=1 Tax=Streptomyces sp. NBC_00063 TaxID=2975638 RepID=UPI00225A1413|nr:HNH endonuclease domain-containing protein [Streptomyces sp. NBC_00063]MCX5441273.1 HNH endonuclease [Streptomyces sp. NBC_00063]
MTADAFFLAEPSARSSWRLAILMGANSRTYKFALGDALLEHARHGHTEMTLRDLAAPYAMSLVAHAAKAPQAPEGTSIGKADFLAVAAAEREETQKLGRPTDLLLEAAVKSMPGMVMQKFHNLRGGTEVPHRFYEVAGTPRRRIVRLTPALLQVAQSEQATGLRTELDARWSIVESSFAAGIGRVLIEEGVSVDWATLKLTDKRRRRPVTGVADALIGFQHGRCLLCDDVLDLADAVAVDHVFPYSLMQRYASVGGWSGPDLDVLWNLAPAHEKCNSTKSDRLPRPDELVRLARRNEAIMGSPHPLRKTLQLALNSGPSSRRSTCWVDFLREVQKCCI